MFVSAKAVGALGTSTGVRGVTNRSVKVVKGSSGMPYLYSYTYKLDLSHLSLIAREFVFQGASSIERRLYIASRGEVSGSAHPVRLLQLWQLHWWAPTIFLLKMIVLILLQVTLHCQQLKKIHMLGRCTFVEPSGIERVPCQGPRSCCTRAAQRKLREDLPTGLRK